MGSLDDALATLQVAHEQPLPKLKLLIPAGLSFYTFACLTYAGILQNQQPRPVQAGEEATFDAALKPLLERNSLQFYDYFLVNNDKNFFFNSDHLNKTGVMAFLDGDLKQLRRR